MGVVRGTVALTSSGLSRIPSRKRCNESNDDATVTEHEAAAKIRGIGDDGAATAIYLALGLHSLEPGRDVRTAAR